jgi:hypothetical protein
MQPESSRSRPSTAVDSPTRSVELLSTRRLLTGLAARVQTAEAVKYRLI